MKIFITGIAGFIGFHLARSLKEDGHEIWGVDNFNSFLYDSEIKGDRAEILTNEGIEVIERAMQYLKLDVIRPDIVVHLAAHAGVRKSLEYPNIYIQNNIVNTQRLIDEMVRCGINKVVYASSSSVMNGNDLPWNEDDPTHHQLNPYSMSKMANECQFKSSDIDTTIGLRFFTVYGPWGRPDMALFKFTKNIIEGKPIDVYNYGNMKRDFTYIEDIVDGTKDVINRAMNIEGNEIYNIGRGKQIPLMGFIHQIEKNVGQKADIKLLSKHPADAEETWSDITKLKSLGWHPHTSVEDGVKQFVDWYKNYYQIK